MPSTVIQSFSHDENSQRLRVALLNGSIYDYLDVPVEVYREMKDSFSKGKFYNEQIKPHYAFEKITESQLSH